MKWMTRIALLALASLAACSDGGGGGGGDAVSPDGGGERKILTKGGTGTYGAGGGSVYFSSGSGLEVLKTGSVNATLSIPDVTPFLGWNPRVIPAGTTVTILRGDYLIDGPWGIRGDTDPGSWATGLHVQAGATLVLEPNTDWRNADYYDRVVLTFQNGIFIEGTVRTAGWIYNGDSKAGVHLGTPIVDSDNTSDLVLDAENVVVASSGRIDLSGADDSDASDGGDIDAAGGNGGVLDIDIDGTIVNKGAIDTTGGDGPDGGDGGSVYLGSFSYGIYNGGPVTTSGAPGTDGYGGNAGSIALISNGSILGIVCNQSDLTATGGDGTDGYGGQGGSISLIANNAGAVVSNGTIDASGGDATTAGSYNGGDAGSLTLSSNAGILRVAGALYARGGGAQLSLEGDSAKASEAALARPEGSVGGRGGSATLGNNIGKPLAAAGLMAPSYAPGEVAIGADIDLSGGNGDWSASGGSVDISSTRSDAEVMYLVGYSLIDCSGGDGDSGYDGGSGSTVSMYNYNDRSKALMPADLDVEAHGLVIEVPLVARGGKGTEGSGGSGGSVSLNNYSTEPLVLSGGIDTSGGDGEHQGGGTVNTINLFSEGDVSITCDLLSSGGNSLGTDWGFGGSASTIRVTSAGGRLAVTGDLLAEGGDSAGEMKASGGQGGSVELLAALDITVTGRISVDGGSSPESGGDCTTSDGTSIQIMGSKVTLDGAVTANGGDGGTTPYSSGGDGGFIEIGSVLPPSVFDPTPTVDGGTGTTPGYRGWVVIDGFGVVTSDNPFWIF
jgi:hypothetical protein